MANPFPGMNPYLEGSQWTSVHTDLSSEIARQLSPRVRPKYAVRTQRRTVTVAPDPTETERGRRPDVGIAEDQREAEFASAKGGGSPILMEQVRPVPVDQTTVHILDADGFALVTAIELLSPTNKRGAGRREYTRKRDRTLDSSANLVEIDLIRVGRRFPVNGPLPDAPYFVFVSRADRRPRVAVWPIALEGPLPTLDVPLKAGESVPLDLQAALSAIDAIFDYDSRIDYERPPPGPLSPELAAWLDQHLRAAGRRK